MRKRAFLTHTGLIGLLALIVGLGPASLAATDPGQAEQRVSRPAQRDPDAAPAAAADTTRTIDVDAIDDDNPAGGCALREALVLANGSWGPGTSLSDCTVTESGSGAPVVYLINLPAYTYTLTGPAGDNNNLSGDLDIGSNVTIHGAGPESTIIDGNNVDRVFHIDPMGVDGFTVALVGLTIRDGLVGGDGGGVHNGGNNTVSIDDCTVTGNQAVEVGGASGGGIYSAGGVVNVTDSTVSDNHATSGPHNVGRGGGISTDYGTLNVTGSTIHNNTVFVNEGTNSSAYGGGIYAFLATVNITSSTISDNKTSSSPGGEFTGNGGGIFSDLGTLSVAEGSILSGNQAKDSGGGIYGNSSRTTVSASTISGNTATDGAGIFAFRGGLTIDDGCALHDSEAGDYGGGIFVSYQGAATVDGSTVSDNSAGKGGGLYNEGTLTIQNNSLIGGEGTGNEATQTGGGIHNERGGVTINDSTVSRNTSETHGGGIYNGDGILMLNNSTVARNTSGRQGGGIYSDGDDGATLMLNRCTISGNTAKGGSGGGGGLYLYYSYATLANTTISGNAASRDHGGGIGTLSDSERTITLLHCTITGNTAATQGGGLQLEASFTVNVSSTIVADNSAGTDGPDIYGAINSQDYNLIRDTSGATIGGTTTHNITGQDPRLGSLADNGGNTQTHALLDGSPALDAIPEAVCPLVSDQRGVSRPQGPACDIGSYEGVPKIRAYLPLVFHH